MPGFLRHLLTAITVILCVAALSIALLGAANTEAASRLLQAQPTADPCAPATLTPAANIVNVRAGPDSDSQLVGQLSAGDVRPVLGRHWQLRWWQIEMSNGSEGWVWDGAVALQGNVAAVPLVTAASEDSQPTEATWEPTVDVVCVATPVTNADRVQTTPAAPVGAAEELNANQNDWSAPSNLSQSGLATEPHMVVDGDGDAHVLWQEQGVDGFLYTRQLDGEWLQPAVVELPFGTRRAFPDLQEDSPTPLFTPVLVAGSEGAIHAFWTDDESILRTSWVPASDFTTFEAWSQPQVIDEFAIGAVTTIGDNDILHLSYIRTEASDDRPTGVYYRQSADGGATWSEPVLLYESRYLRAVTEQNARVQIATAGTRVYLAWDNPILEKVFLARSTGDGQTWSPVTTVDERQADDPTEAAGPSKITLSVRADEVLLLWQAAHDDLVCEQHYRYSDDGGANWGANGVILDEFNTCPTDTQVVVPDAGVMLLLIMVDGQPYLMAWDGANWSEPQSQPTLSSFFDPQTNRQLQFAWQDALLLDGDRIAVLGVDRGVSGDQQSQSLRADVWFIERLLGSTTDWFPPPSPWLSPTVVAERPFQAQDLVTISDPASVIHGFWSQPEESDGAETVIYYTRREGDVWTRPVLVMRSPEGPAQQPAVAATADRLFIIWVADAGSIYFSQVATDRAPIAADWAEPVLLPLPHDAARSPAIAIGRAGHIYVVYSVPLNEERGIWITDSADSGRTWSVPHLIFDGAASGAAMIDDPQLAISENGDLHLLWTEYSLPPASVPQALNYSYSRDGGESWISPSLVAEMPGSWSAILALREREVHRLWQQPDTATMRVGHDVSVDEGMNWSTPDQVELSGAEGSLLTYAADPANRVHLVQLNVRGLQHRWWQDNRWLRGEEQQFDDDIAELYMVADAAITADGYLAVLYAGRLASGDAEGEPYRLLATGRSIELPADLPTPLPTLTATPSPTSAPVMTGTVTPTPTPDLSAAETVPDGPLQALTSNVPGLDTRWGGAAVGIVIAGLLTLIVVAVAVLLLRTSHKRRR